MNKCPRCKNENLKEEYNYCPICGVNLGTAPEVPVREQLLEIKIDGRTIASSILKTHDS